MSKTLYLLRHGTVGADGRFLGATDLPLSPDGIGQTQRIRSAIASRGVDAILCSPMLRCRQTLEHLQLDLAAIVDEDLREADFGLWENRSFSEIAKEYPDLVSVWQAAPDAFSFPEGESIATFYARIGRLHRAIVDYPARRLLVVSHAGIIRHLICAMLDIDLVNNLLFRIDPGKIAVIDLFSEGGVLRGLNLGGALDG